MSSVAAIDANTTYDQTHQQIAAFARRIVYSVCGDADVSCQTTVEFLDDRALESCVVERAGATARAADAGSLIVGVRAIGGKHVWRYIIKDFTPLRRVLNAYAGQKKKDVGCMRLLWKGQVVGFSDTAKQLGIYDGCELGVEWVSVKKPGCLWDDDESTIKQENVVEA
ncbi:hypothetical protein B0A48_07290 [Cryoendolithus antarcticus]|uniref:Ubiquitin-like domain-containing protein n=1 Tax=Cryoendolithus antarcticus TaxID=1507870 RepID=A0A1V8T856_9PEZI|nr:hypothetical protein B0A48_07290 [Cryoendolithus antarcticus]